MERNELLGHLAEETVSTDEEIEVLGVEVNHHTRSAAGGADRTVESKLKPLHGANVGAQHSLMIGVFSGEAGSVEEAEAERTIDGKRVFCTDVEGGSECAGFVLLALVVPAVGLFMPEHCETVMGWLDSSVIAGDLYNNNLLLVLFRDFL